MIPPLKEMRLRSIRRWMKDYAPTSQSGARTAEQIDGEMLAAFDERVNQLQSSMMDSKDWGSTASTQRFQTGQLEAWQRVTAEFLPVTTGQ